MIFRQPIVQRRGHHYALINLIFNKAFRHALFFARCRGRIGSICVAVNSANDGSIPDRLLVREKFASLAGQIGPGPYDDKTREKLQQKFAQALNAALREELLALLPPNDRSLDLRKLLLAVPANSRRVRRFILEDLFHPWIYRDVKPTWGHA